jgi:hypothetical protein
MSRFKSFVIIIVLILTNFTHTLFAIPVFSDLNKRQECGAFDITSFTHPPVEIGLVSLLCASDKYKLYCAVYDIPCLFKDGGNGQCSICHR